MNFLPEDYLEKKAQQRTNIICLLLFILVLSGIAAGWFLTESRRKLMETQKLEMAERMELAGDSLAKLENLEKKKLQMQDKAQLSAMLTEPIPRSLLLATITNNLPAGVSLLSYNLDTREVKVALPKPTTTKTATAKTAASKKKSSEPEKPVIPVKKFETEVRFIGLAGSDLEVAQLISDLSKSNLMANVSLKYSEEFIRQESTYKRFEISAIMNPETKATEADVMWARKQHIKNY
ncbi:MAG: hypothetical protein JW745_06620 [Sedimentisphaerales bacterium]|nr:hypothetical protein [Sedimentisphaerales bacterium]